ncbi:hypothetical protein COCMIDRAFT_34392 [Bipolaris oryzae ATCC 44560]|uniref:Uncharacterized protein n=1 Tax=Bipolaris oryzae ATCC 44560 TaxID=930090 RepID=W6ZE73_COCMI|nr:uncharacterized protein COCMIDRAFT_34392 [Bipolaris oryzae ATCC 44560]EUC48168.1 hypothetical protein COCMIDRAFT_34392 [Bipolaris oryzae ATCC 44560]
MWWEWGALSGWAGQALINGPDAGGVVTASEAVQKKRATVCLRGSVACSMATSRALWGGRVPSPTPEP